MEMLKSQMPIRNAHDAVPILGRAEFWCFCCLPFGHGLPPQQRAKYTLCFLVSSQTDTSPMTDPTLRATLAVCHRLAIETVGPHGEPCLVHTNGNSEAVTLTSLSARLGDALSVQHPVARVVLDAVCARGRSGMPDGGWLQLLLTTGLVDRSQYVVAGPLSAVLADGACTPAPALELFADVIAVPLLLAGHQVAMQWIYDFLQHPACPARFEVPLSSLSHLLILCKSILGAKTSIPWRTGDVEHLALLLVTAFVEALPDDGVPAAAETVDVLSHIRLVVEPGRDLHDSMCLAHTVLLDVPWPFGLASDVTWSNARTICYNISLCMDEDAHCDLNVVGPLLEETDNVRIQLLEALLTRWQSVGVQIVWCQKLLHPWLKAMLPVKGILGVERLSLRHVATVHRACGGHMLGSVDLDAITPAVLGSVGRVSEWLCGEKRWIRLQGSSHSFDAVTGGKPVSTVLIGAPHSLIKEELETVAQSCLTVLAHSLTTPGRLVLAGGGATENLLSLYLRMRSQRDLGSTVRLPRGLRPVHYGYLRATVLSVADCLDEYVGAICGRHAGTWRAVADTLHVLHRPLVEPLLLSPAAVAPIIPRRIFGCVVSDRVECGGSEWQPTCVLSTVEGGLVQCAVWDSYAAKIRSLELAIDGAGTILRVGGVVMNGR
jgi:hypothetical protein